jgi:uncharacterized protein
MFDLIHRVIVAVYWATPIIAALLCLRKSNLFRARFAASLLLGIIIGITINFAGVVLESGYVKWTQVLLTAYLAASLLLILKGFDLLLCNLIAHLIFSAITPPRWFRRQIALGLRIAVLFVLGLSYILATGLTYRTKITSSQNPQSVLHVDYKMVKFTTADGLHIAAWWIPSARPNAFYANRTILLCPGYSADKSTQLNLVRQLVPECFNVLAIDFRARGDSDGQLSTFGDLERRDVLAAVHWLLTEHPQQATKIYGIGESTGAAALIAAAADPGADGQAIAAIVAYSPFARLDDLATEMTGQVFAQPAAMLVRLGLPMASAQTGTNLNRFSPADLVSRLWPRPILIIHSQGDELIPWDQGEALYRAASYPKDYYWLDNKTHKQTMLDESVARYVLRFLQSAQPIPVI